MKERKRAKERERKCIIYFRELAGNFKQIYQNLFKIVGIDEMPRNSRRNSLSGL